MVLVATTTTLVSTNSMNGSGSVKSSGSIGGSGTIGNGGTKPATSTWGPLPTFNLVVEFFCKLW
jgi:hypothetical protein